MERFKLIYRNLLRHPLRSVLTCLGIAVALFAFTFIRTIIAAWYAGVDASAKNRLVTRNSVSLVFYLPKAYGPRIAQVPGVELVGFGNWFGGVFRDEEFRFAQFAIDDNYLEIYPEYVVSPDDKRAWLSDRKGIIVGKEIADEFGLKTGDVIQIKGTIFPGLWEFTVRSVYTGREPDTDTRVMLFHWDYLNERNRKEIGRQPDQVGFYVLRIGSGIEPAVVSKAVDEIFKNSFAETLTETETAFIQSFVSMSSAIITAMNVVSGVVVVIMLLVLTNTMLMSFRERYREYSILKSLGFGAPELSAILLGEALLLCGGGFLLLLLFLIPFFVLPPKALLGQLSDFFPIFAITPLTLALVFGLALLVAFAASAVPAFSMARLKVTEGLRQIV